MASNLHGKVERLRGRGAEDRPFYSLTLLNSQLVSGRSLSFVVPASFEDIVALRDALDKIVTRKEDEVEFCAKQPGTAKFAETE